MADDYDEQMTKLMVLMRQLGRAIRNGALSPEKAQELKIAAWRLRRACRAELKRRDALGIE